MFYVRIHTVSQVQVATFGELAALSVFFFFFFFFFEGVWIGVLG